MAESDILEDFTCRICLEIFEEPVTVPCGHVFCKKCLRAQGSEQCTLCREEFDKKSVRRSTDTVHAMRNKTASCYGCHQKIPLRQMRAHLQACDKIDRSIPEFQPVKPTTQRYPRDLPNRSTFQCPYCDAENLTCSALVDHCNNGHKNDTASVVCPVCASMPWGDQSQQSQNFIQHLNLRHRFEYDTYVEYNQDEDAMLEAALQASLTDR